LKKCSGLNSVDFFSSCSPPDNSDDSNILASNEIKLGCPPIKGSNLVSIDPLYISETSPAYEYPPFLGVSGVFVSDSNSPGDKTTTVILSHPFLFLRLLGLIGLLLGDATGGAAGDATDDNTGDVADNGTFGKVSSIGEVDVDNGKPESLSTIGFGGPSDVGVRSTFCGTPGDVADSILATGVGNSGLLFAATNLGICTSVSV